MGVVNGNSNNALDSSDGNSSLSVLGQNELKNMIKQQVQNVHVFIDGDADDSFNVRERSHTHEISCLKQKVEMMSKEFDVKNKQCNKEKDSLKKMIRELEARITNLTGENEDSNVLNKMEVETIQKKINEVEKYNQELKNEILKMTQENSLLQDTVRRECEERFELTEALSYISEQLKSNKI